MIPPPSRRPVSLRLRLTLVPAVLGIVLALGAAMVEIGVARQRVDSERVSAGEMADRLLGLALAGIGGTSADPMAEVADAVRALSTPRHIRLFVLPRDEDALTRFRQSLTTGGDGVPGWVAALLHPTPWERWRTIVQDERQLGYVVAAADPFDEMAEVWEEMQVLLALLLGLTAAFIALVAWSVARASQPVLRLTQGLKRLERGDYDSRLSPFAITELEPLADTFNTLADTLRRMDGDNRRLIAQLLSVQEAERNLLAGELHDELGPTLFGIRVHASCLKRTPGGKGADEILALADELQRLNRRILDRLRPSCLHDLRVEAALSQLVADWSARLPAIAWEFRCEGLDIDREDDLALGLYRIAQEALTNAARHAEARHVRLEIRQEAGAVRIMASDDGQGFDPATRTGFGLAGMRERVRCLGGEMRLNSTPGNGTRLDIGLPTGTLARQPQGAAA